MKELKYFNQLSEYNSNKDNFEYPTVSYVEENKEVYYMEKEKPYAIYRTTGASQEVRLFGYDSDEVKNYIDKVTIEETGEVITGNSYTFANAGDHKVYIELNPDITEIGNVYFNGSVYDGSTIFRINDFKGVSELISVSENLFSNCTKVTDFSYTFQYCSGLTSIPENLFSNNTKVTDFSWAFENCNSLTSIPSNLFSNNTEVTNFTHTFVDCTGLTSIPENLFSNNTKVTDFSWAFAYCSGLTGSIPANLFSNNTAVTSFYGTFHSCSGLTGNVPTDTDGTPIYNRSTPGKSGYAIVTSYTGCFYNCTGLTDYSSIPSSWGGGGA